MVKKKTGRKTKYHKSYARLAEIACQEGGFTDAKLAKLFDVSKATIANWKNEHKVFLESIKRGKDSYDSENVEKNTLKRAKGFRTVDVTRELDDKGDLVITKTVSKLIPSETAASIFWLTNRRPDRWKRNGASEHGDAKPQPIKVEIIAEDARITKD